jgi:general transcription factor 3C polypeptide 5 (transcription factor C subunit 1)
MESNDHHHAHANPDVAPFMSVPSGRLVSIEHPCIVRNFDNAFKSLGGEAQIKHVSE